ncbi:hypothetical protein [Rathayibacter sp. SD072]|uniref:hypothetical protein n=1 Tax=Rathayibacter sp. SD072 TaxID=2781731 RepID=UPI001A95DD52|nr:hypothetical protein [Rathayibacter sp. SD072]MBO0983320.1 hypothetical protein [Rathayibacter sp. SD072]
MPSAPVLDERRDIDDERTEMMLSEYSFPALLEERERRLERELEHERVRRERREAPPARPGLRVILRRALTYRADHAGA